MLSFTFCALTGHRWGPVEHDAWGGHRTCPRCRRIIGARLTAGWAATDTAELREPPWKPPTRAGPHAPPRFPYQRPRQPIGMAPGSHPR
jgi:hypothetical protein